MDGRMEVDLEYAEVRSCFPSIRDLAFHHHQLGDRCWENLFGEKQGDSHYYDHDRLHHFHCPSAVDEKVSLQQLLLLSLPLH
jgi:hypothetical protein